MPACDKPEFFHSVEVGNIIDVAYLNAFFIRAVIVGTAAREKSVAFRKFVKARGVVERMRRIINLEPVEPVGLEPLDKIVKPAFLTEYERMRYYRSAVRGFYKFYALERRYPL